LDLYQSGPCTAKPPIPFGCLSYLHFHPWLEIDHPGLSPITDRQIFAFVLFPTVAFTSWLSAPARKGNYTAFEHPSGFEHPLDQPSMFPLKFVDLLPKPAEIFGHLI